MARADGLEGVGIIQTFNGAKTPQTDGELHSLAIRHHCRLSPPMAQPN